MSDIDIAQAATPKPITEIAEALKIPDEALEPYGRIKGKVSLDWLLRAASARKRADDPRDRGESHARR